MAGNADLTTLLIAIGNNDHVAAQELLTASPSLVTATLARSDEFFLAERLAQLYQGDTALRAAGFSYDADMAQELVTRGSDIRAKNRRGAGADLRLQNDSGSTASDLARWTTGRGGTGSSEANAERQVILELLQINAG